MAKNQNIPGWPEMPSITGSASQLNNPFTNGLAGGMDFIKNFWGNSASGVPGFVVPTVDLKDLEKRIKDLKAVEGWLDVNLNMLRTTIQALEVQHSTIATIHAISDSMSASAGDAAKSMMNQASTAPSSGFGSSAPELSDPPAKPRQRKAKAKPGSGLPPGWPSPVATPAASVKSVSVKPASARTSADDADDAPPAKKTKPAAKTVAAKPDGANDGSNPAEQAAASAGAWLNFLQDQFSKVAMKSITPSAGAETNAAAKPADDAKAKTAGKTSSRRAAAKAAKAGQ